MDFGRDIKEEIMRHLKIYFLIFLVIIFGLINITVFASSSKEFKTDFTTPQGAVLCLEDAYRSKNIEKILLCKDFELEAIYMLKYQLKNSNFESDRKLVEDLAETLRLSFIKEIKKYGVLEFGDVVKSEFKKVKTIDTMFVIVTEVCTYTDGGKSVQELVVGKSKDGWRMLIPLD